MRPKHPPREAPQGLRPVAKRVPTVQGRPAWMCANMLGAPQDSLLRSSPRKRGPRAADQVSRSRVSLRSPHEVVDSRWSSPSRKRGREWTECCAPPIKTETLCDSPSLWRSRISGAPPSACARASFDALWRCAASGTRAQISQPRGVSSTNGKPPGGDPAAPVRRRSCRGAGSATAGARLGMW